MNSRFRKARRVFARLSSLALCVLAARCSGVPSPEQLIPPTSKTRHAAAATAIDQLGEPYVPNRTGPKAFDAAGLAYYAYRRAGARLPRGVAAQLDTGKPITLARAQPADLVFFQVHAGNGAPRKTVGVLTSKKQMVIAAAGGRAQNRVQLVDMANQYWHRRLIGVIRVLP